MLSNLSLQGGQLLDLRPLKLLGENIIYNRLTRIIFITFIVKQADSTLVLRVGKSCVASVLIIMKFLGGVILSILLVTLWSHNKKTLICRFIWLVDVGEAPEGTLIVSGRRKHVLGTIIIQIWIGFPVSFHVAD